MSGLTLAQPFWLLLLPLPWLLRPWLRRRHDERLGRLIEPHLWPLLIQPRPRRRQGAFSRRFLAAWVLAILAASGPQLTKQDQAPQPRGGIDLVVVVDISPSMAVSDMAPNRLERAKFELRDFLAGLQGKRLALVVYSAQAYRLLPLTSDSATVAHFVAALDSGMTRRHGSNLTMALETASELLQDSPSGSRAVLLLSDGEVRDAASARAAARRLGHQNIPLLIMGIGTPAGGPVYGAHGRFLQHEGQVVISHLDRTLLSSLARLSGGRYTPLQSDDSDWERLRAAMARLTPYNREATTPAPQAALLYPGLLAASLILFLSGGLRLPLPRPLPALFLLTCLPLPLSTPQAGPWQEQQAYDALQSGDYQAATRLYGALDSYHGALGRGVAAYRQGDWQAALSAFREAARLAGNKDERAQAAYNTGTTLLRLGELEDAAQALEQTLRWQPHHKGAALNLGLIKEARRALRGDEPPRLQQSAPLPLNGGTNFLPRASSGMPAGMPQGGGRPTASADQGSSPRPLGEADAALIVRLRMAEQEAAFEALPEDKPW